MYKKNLTWWVRKKEIMLFPMEAKKIEYAKIYYRLQGTKPNQIPQNFHSFTITANICENNGR